MGKVILKDGKTMLPYISVFGKIVPTYGILGFAGIVIAICFGVFYFSKFYDIKKEDIFYASMFAMIGIGIGAKLLYIINYQEDRKGWSSWEFFLVVETKIYAFSFAFFVFILRLLRK